MASADPVGDAEDDIYGLVTPGSVREVWASGQGTCVTLDQAYESSSSVNSDDVVAVTEDYPRPGLGS